VWNLNRGKHEGYFVCNLFFICVLWEINYLTDNRGLVLLALNHFGHRNKLSQNQWKIYWPWNNKGYGEKCWLSRDESFHRNGTHYTPAERSMAFPRKTICCFERKIRYVLTTGWRYFCIWYFYSVEIFLANDTLLEYSRHFDLEN